MMGDFGMVEIWQRLQKRLEDSKMDSSLHGKVKDF